MNTLSTVELIGSKITLVPFNEDHITDTYVSWLNDQEMSTIILSAETTTTLKECEIYAMSLIESDDNHFFAMVTNDTNEHIGNFRLGPYDRHNNRIQLGMMIGNKDYWDKGIGTEVVRLGLEFAFRNLKVHKVFLVVREDNAGAIKIYEKNGFFHGGILKDHVKKNNRYYDLVLMSAINPYEIQKNNMCNNYNNEDKLWDSYHTLLLGPDTERLKKIAEIIRISHSSNPSAYILKK